MRQNNTSKKNIYLILWLINITTSLGMGQALCQRFSGSIVMRLLPVLIGIILSLSVTLVIMKGLRMDQVRPLVFIQTLYWGVAFYSMAYQKVYEEATASGLLGGYLKMSIIVSLGILGIILLSIIGLSRAYKRLEKQFHTSNLEQLNQLYYACVLPKLIVGSVGFIIGYLMVIHIINKCLFTGIGTKSFYTAMCFIVAGVGCLSFTIGIIVSKWVRKS